MKNSWVGSEETLWNMAQCRASLQCELNSPNPHGSVSCHERAPERCRWGGESVMAWALCDFWLKTSISKKWVFFLFLFCFSDTLKWKLHAALPPSKEVAEQRQIQLLGDTSCWRWERANLVFLCKDWGLQTGKLGDVVYSIVDVKSSGGSQMRNLCLPNEKREDRPQEATDIEYFAGISLILPG